MTTNQICACIEVLKSHALKHYEDGGHWVYETFQDEDYREILVESNWDLETARRDMVSYWELIESRRKDCSWE